MSEITRVLRAIDDGEPGAGDRLLEMVYQDLRYVAARKMARERAVRTLQATALVHEAWLRLGGDAQPSWRNRAHFFAAAAEAMRRILIGRARRRRALRRGGGQAPVDIDAIEVAAPMDDETVLALDEALRRLAAADPRKVELVKLRYFAGLTLTDAARTLGISEPTAKRWWSYARAWLQRELAR